MALPTAREIQKLAKACRKAGIRTFKAEGIEFTLTDEQPTTKRASQKASKQPIMAQDEEFKSDTITDEQMLFWSAQGLPETNPDTPAGN